MTTRHHKQSLGGTAFLRLAHIQAQPAFSASSTSARSGIAG